MKRGAVAVIVLGIFASVGLHLLLRDGYTLAPRPSLDVATWEVHDDQSAGWSLRHPGGWHLQMEQGRFWGNRVVVISNVGANLVHPDLGPSSATALWDMRELPREFVIVQLEEPADVSPGRRGSQRTLPLSLDNAQRAARAARFGVPHGLWLPVYLDSRHVYIVRAWFGPDASEHDREIAERIVASMRFDLD